MDPLLLLRKHLKLGGAEITLHDNDGNPVDELSQCVYLKLGNYIYARDQSTNFRSKRGAGDFYSLDAVWFMYNKRDSSYGEYMQEARRNGISAVSLVDRKDLISYLEEDERPENYPSIDITVPLPTPRRSFTGEEPPEEEITEEAQSLTVFEPSITVKNITSRPCRARDSVFVSGKDFTDIIETTKEIHKSLEIASSNIQAQPKQPISLIEQIASANRPIPTTTKRIEPERHKYKDFIPIIVVPATPTASLTMYNVTSFLIDGVYIFTSDAKSKVKSKENSLIIEHKFAGRVRKIQIIDNPTRLTLEDWRRVVAVFVQGSTWQFKGWKWESPIDLFQNVKGFSLEFEDTKTDSNIASWNVQCLTIGRSRRHLDTTANFQFWSSLEDFLKRKRLIN